MTLSTKKPPIVAPLTVSTFVMHQSEYRIDRTYQRDEDVWDRDDEAYLIDTILRGLSIPLVYIHKKDGKEYIVDGQQRINTINKFYKNKIDLQERYSKDIIKANNYKTKYKHLLPEYKLHFDNYPINIAYLENYTDDDIRSTFRRLQSGKPLNAGEKLNSYAGSIVPTLRGLGSHKFFDKITMYSSARHKHLLLAAQLFHLEHNGIIDLNTSTIFQFVENNENLKATHSSVRAMKGYLNLLTKIFKEKTGEIEKPGWIISLYLLVSYLDKNYAIKNLKSEIRDFFVNFYHKVENAPSTRNVTLNRFFEAVSKSTTSKKNIQARHDILVTQFLKEYHPSKKDENRLFSRKQKLQIFRRDSEKCTVCNKRLEFGNSSTHYHHSEMHVEGGETEIRNGVLVCKSCHHNKIHKTM